MDRRRSWRTRAVALALLIASAAFGWWLLGTPSRDANREKQATSETQQLKTRVRIVGALLDMHDSTARSLTQLAQDLGPAIQDKEKVKPERIKQIDESLTHFKKEIEQAGKLLDALGQDARSNLEGEHQMQVLAEIVLQRDYLSRLEKAHDQFRADFEKAFGKQNGEP